MCVCIRVCACVHLCKCVCVLHRDHCSREADDLSHCTDVTRVLHIRSIDKYLHASHGWSERGDLLILGKFHGLSNFLICLKSPSMNILPNTNKFAAQ